MGVVKKIKEKSKAKKQEKIKQVIIRNGFILFGLNVALTLGLFFTLMVFVLGLSAFDNQGLLQPFMPLVAIFLFAGISAIVWFRFGQIMARQFKGRKIFYGALAVLISVVLLLLTMLFVAFLLSGLNVLPDSMAMIFLGTLFITLISSVFELPVVAIGIVSAK